MVNLDVRLFLTDIDGVWTDGGMYYTEHGDELKKFSVSDSSGVLFLRFLGIPLGIITGEDTSIVQRRAEKLKIPFVFQGVRNKVAVADNLRKELELEWHQIAYIGDDVNDIQLLRKVGLSAAPANAKDYVKKEVSWVMDRKGGDGAFSEFIELFLKHVGRLDEAIETYFCRQNEWNR